MKKFSDLTEREVLTGGIASEEEDSRTYMSFAENLGERYPESARIFEGMAEEEKWAGPLARGLRLRKACHETATGVAAEGPDVADSAILGATPTSPGVQ